MHAMSALKEGAARAYKDIQDMIDNMVRNDSAEERAKIADAAKCRMSDYSSLRWRAALKHAETGE
jgi:hypothetical protein